jgi:uncharacterized protein
LQQSKIDKLKIYFSEKLVFRAYLFGSYACGNADGKSDIEILLEMDYSCRIGLKFVEMKEDIEEMMQCKVDLVTENALDKYIRSGIEKEKVLIYERK